jgi:hypothetical protein
MQYICNLYMLGHFNTAQYMAKSITMYPTLAKLGMRGTQNQYAKPLVRMYPARAKLAEYATFMSDKFIFYFILVELVM